jgi:hypothetical protein
VKSKSRFFRSQRQTIVSAILLFVVLLAVLQLWLFTASTNAYLAGDRSIALPAALVSLVCFGVNLAFLRYLYRLE